MTAPPALAPLYGPRTDLPTPGPGPTEPAERPAAAQGAAPAGIADQPDLDVCQGCGQRRPVEWLAPAGPGSQLAGRRLVCGPCADALHHLAMAQHLDAQHPAGGTVGERLVVLLLGQ